MSLTDDQIEAKNFQKFYNAILPYLNGAAHSGFTPIGTVISVMGTTAPLNYLACDGTVYNIADYTELAAYFNAQFGSSNFFGGNGTTTFAVPDLRGEFLRGTGTNSHANQGSGAAVGEHQDGTGIPNIALGYDGLYANNIPSSGSVEFENTDGGYKKNVSGQNASVNIAGKWTTTSNNMLLPRPTNTSVLYCIASKNIFMDAGSNYSTEEQVVGTWIDGKPIYQKTWVINNSITIRYQEWIELPISSTGIQKLINGTMLDVFDETGRTGCSNILNYISFAMNVNGKIGIFSVRDQEVTRPSYIVTLRYTKTTN